MSLSYEANGENDLFFLQSQMGRTIEQSWIAEYGEKKKIVNSRSSNLRLARDPPRQTGAAAQPLDGTGSFIDQPSRGMERSQTTAAGVSHHAA